MAKKRELSLRYQQVKDAKVIYTMMTHPKSTYYPNSAKDLKRYTDDIRRNLSDRDKDGEYTYSVMRGKTMIGSISLRIDKRNPENGELALMIHHKAWNKGYATEAVLQMEKRIAKQYGIKTVTMMIRQSNKVMLRVAEKCGYQRGKTIKDAFWQGADRVAGIAFTKTLLSGNEKVTIRYQQLKDAKRFYEILNHPSFVYFPAKAESVEAEKEFIRKSQQMRREKSVIDHTILLDGHVIGGIGLTIDRKRAYCAEIGYFIDYAYWGHGYTPQAVQLLEEIAVTKYGIRRIEILTLKANKASQRVALKCGYSKEGIARGKLAQDGGYHDGVVFAKTFQ